MWLPGPADAFLLPAASRQDAVAVGVELDAVPPLAPPLVGLVGVVEVEVAGELLAEGERGGSLRLALRPLEFGLHDEMIRAPGVREVDVLQIQRLEAVPPT